MRLKYSFRWVFFAVLLGYLCNLIPSVMGLTGSIGSFEGKTNPFYIYGTNVNNTYVLKIPMFTNLTNLSITVKNRFKSNSYNELIYNSTFNESRIVDKRNVSLYGWIASSNMNMTYSTTKGAYYKNALVVLAKNSIDTNSFYIYNFSKTKKDLRVGTGYSLNFSVGLTIYPSPIADPDHYCSMQFINRTNEILFNFGIREYANSFLSSKVTAPDIPIGTRKIGKYNITMILHPDGIVNWTVQNTSSISKYNSTFKGNTNLTGLRIRAGSAFKWCNMTVDYITISSINLSYNPQYTISVNNSQKQTNKNRTFEYTNTINTILNKDCQGGQKIGLYCYYPISFFIYHQKLSENISVNLSKSTYSYGIDNCTTNKFKILNMSYYDQTDNSNIVANNGYVLNFDYGLTQALSVSGSFSNKKSNAFCSLVNLSARGINSSITGTFSISNSGYGTNLYTFNNANPIIGKSSPITKQKFYIVPLANSSTIVYTWRTSSYQLIDGIMQIYKCLGNGTRILYSSTPIITGEATANIDLINTLYSYEVIYNGVLYTDAASYSTCHIETDTTREYIIKVQQDTSNVIGIYSIPCNLTKTGNYTISLKWGSNPKSSSTITGCIWAYRTSAIGSFLVYTNCSTISPITRNVPQSSYTYTVNGRLYQNGYSIECGNSISISTSSNPAKTFGMMGIYSMLFLIVGMILLFSNESPEYFPIIGVGSIIIGWIVGLTPLGWVSISSLVAFVIIIIVIGRYHKKE